MRLRRVALPVVAVLATVMVMAGCGGDAPPPSATGTAGSSTTGAVPTAPPPTGAVPTGTASGAPAVPSTLDFTARTTAGGDFRGASLAGRPTVLWFWAPWCSTCAGQAKGVKATAERLAGTVNVVGVAGLGEETAMRQFITRWKLDGMPHLSDDAGAVWKKFGVTSQSTFVLLDSRGAVVHKGVLNGDDLLGRAGSLR